MGTKFKIGDKFIPRKPKEEYPDIAWVGSMDEYDGKIQIVERMEGQYLIAESGWDFHPDWCEKVQTTSEPPMQITYERALELGFIRHDSEDTVFFNKYGYPYFYLELEIGDRAFEWDIHTHRVNYFVNGDLVKEDITSTEFEELLRADNEIEIFQDKSYFDMYCLRYVGDREFQGTWHFTELKDAEMFKELLLKAK